MARILASRNSIMREKSIKITFLACSRRSTDEIKKILYLYWSFLKIRWAYREPIGRVESLEWLLWRFNRRWQELAFPGRRICVKNRWKWRFLLVPDAQQTELNNSYTIVQHFSKLKRIWCQKNRFPSGKVSFEGFSTLLDTFWTHFNIFSHFLTLFYTFYIFFVIFKVTFSKLNTAEKFSQTSEIEIARKYRNIQWRYFISSLNISILPRHNISRTQNMREKSMKMMFLACSGRSTDGIK